MQIKLNPSPHLSFVLVSLLVLAPVSSRECLAQTPIDYQEGERYPLVIQTHGWNPQRFWPDGPYSSAFAAQPLAGKGIVVVQLEENVTNVSTSKEGPNEMAAYEGAVDYLV